MISGISLNAAASTGPGTAVAFDVPKAIAGAQITTTGSPSSVDVFLEGSLDGVNFFSLCSQQAIGAGGGVIWTGGNGGSPGSGGAMPPILFLRANLAAINGGTSPTVTALVAGA